VAVKKELHRDPLTCLPPACRLPAGRQGRQGRQGMQRVSQRKTCVAICDFSGFPLCKFLIKKDFSISKLPDKCLIHGKGPCHGIYVQSPKFTKYVNASQINYRLLKMARYLIPLQKIGIKLRISLTGILLLFCLIQISGQTDTFNLKTDTLPANYFRLHTTDRDGLKLPEINIKEVVIIGRPSTSKKFPFWRYERMVYNLKKVYPYALMVRSRLDSINRELVTMPEDRQRKKYLRQVEKGLFGEYEDDVRDMTITQGRLLIKLIDRETLNTSYDLIRQYRGTFSAAFWQSIARIFGTNLKEEYDPYGKDAIIEIILHEIESGNL